MRRRIWLDQQHIPITLSRFGFSLLLTGLATSDGPRIKDLSLALGQGTETFTPKSVSLATGLLVPNAAAKVPCRFLASVGNGLAISATFPPDRRAAPGLATLVARVFWSDDFVETLRLCTIWLEPIAPCEFDCAIGPDTIGIALATYNPDIFLFRKQIESIRRQTYGDWVCAISDDCSGPAQLSGMQAVIDTDSRFALAFSANNSGVYRNFERAIALLPERCGWVACSDQDDEWASEKLEVLIGEAKRTQSPAVFSDMEIYSSTGKRLADTFWTYRRLETKNPTAIAIANTVTGMAMLMRSSVLSTALPFPALPGMAYHDRWLTLAALAQGELHYVGKPLVRYIQHPGNHTGVLKRPAGILVLTLRFVKCLAECGVALLRPSRRHALPAQLERCVHWSSIEWLSLSLQIEALQQRLARESWRPEVSEHFRKLSSHPTSALFNVSLESLWDPYRRHMLVGLALGNMFHSLVSSALRCAALLRNFSRKVKVYCHVR